MRMNAGLGAPVAPAPQAARESAPALDSGTWFEAATPFGALRLCVFTGQGARHAADAALSLERCEVLLAGLHAWTGIALDWQWCAKAPRRPSGSHAAACWEPGPAPDGDGPPRELICLLSLPWALLRASPPPPEPLAAHLRWPSVPALLAVAQLQLADEDLALIEPGGALILPASLHASWAGCLRTVDEPSGAGVPVVMASADGARLGRGAEAEAAPARKDDVFAEERVPCEVRLAIAHTLPGDCFTGWRDGQALEDLGPRATLWSCASERGPAQQIAAGRLMPWGDGWALAFESLGG
jgi:hypothetical protein